MAKNIAIGAKVVIPNVSIATKVKAAIRKKVFPKRAYVPAVLGVSGGKNSPNLRRECKKSNAERMLREHGEENKMKKTVEQLQEENKQLLLQRDQWRTIAIAYLVQSEKAGVHEKVFKMLNEEQKIMVKKEVTAILAGMEKGGL